MNGMMMAASSGEQNAGASVNASDAGRERFTTRYEERRDSPWNSGKGADGPREAREVWKGDGSASLGGQLCWTIRRTFACCLAAPLDL